MLLAHATFIQTSGYPRQEAVNHVTDNIASSQVYVARCQLRLSISDKKNITTQHAFGMPEVSRELVDED
jgi:hypothetical protein